jgi:hypothetical protein
MIIEGTTKEIEGRAWAEVVTTLANLFAWPHPPEGYHKIICFELGKGVGETNHFPGGKEAKLVKSGVKGRYHLLVGGDSIGVYALKEMLVD